MFLNMNDFTKEEIFSMSPAERRLTFGMRGGGGGGPKVLPKPPEELALIKKQADVLDLKMKLDQDQRELVKETQAQLKLFAPTAEDAERLRDLSKLEFALKKSEFEFTQTIRGMLEEEFAKGPSELLTRLESISSLQADRLETALKGEAPLSEGSIQRRIKAKEKLEESLARRGIKPGSTAYIQSKGQFEQTFGLLEDTERRAEITAGTSGLLGLTGLAFGRRQQRFTNIASLSQPGGLASLYGAQTGRISEGVGLSEGFGAQAGQSATLLGQAQQTFQFQRNLEFEASKAAAANKAAITGAAIGAVGSIAGGLLPICWVARAIYGEESTKWRYARHFIFDLWEGRIAVITRKIYIKYGESIAEKVKRNSWLKTILKPLFDIAVKKGKQGDYYG